MLNLIMLFFNIIILNIINNLYPQGGVIVGKKKIFMTKDAAKRIQSHSDKTGKNVEFKKRVQKTVDKKKKWSFVIFIITRINIYSMEEG